MNLRSCSRMSQLKEEQSGRCIGPKNGQKSEKLLANYLKIFGAMFRPNVEGDKMGGKNSKSVTMRLKVAMREN